MSQAVGGPDDGADGTGGVGGPAAADVPDGPDDPDDAVAAVAAASPTGGARRTAVVLPVVEVGQALAVAVLRRVEADAVPCERGVMLLPRGPLSPQKTALLSRSAGRHDVLLLTLADEQVSVERWRAGRLVDTPAYGVVGGVDGDAERVLLGRLEACEAAGHASTDGVERAEATRTLLSGAAGPVSGRQVALSAALLGVALVLLVYNVVTVLTAPASAGFTFGAALSTGLWLLLALYFGRQLLRQVRRRREARRRDVAVGESPGDDVGERGPLAP